MVVRLVTRQTRKLAEELADMHSCFFPDVPDSQRRFYLKSPNELYIDEDIDREFISVIDEMVCRYCGGNHDVLRMLRLARRVRRRWGIRLDDAVI